MGEHQKALLYETKSNAKALKVFQDEMEGLKQVLSDSLEQTMWDVFGIRERVVEYERKLCLDAVIYAETLDLFKSAPGWL